MTTTTETRIVCPTWCTLAPDAHDVEQSGSTLHEGPTFGSIQITQGADRQGRAEEPLNASTGTTLDLLEATDLRLLAADCLTAAEWLEAQA